jgi:hypothetical protein
LIPHRATLDPEEIRLTSDTTTIRMLRLLG